MFLGSLLSMVILLFHFSLYDHAIVKRIKNIIGEIPVFSLGLATPLEITDAPQMKTNWSMTFSNIEDGV